MIIILMIIKCTFMCSFSQSEHTARYKKSKSTVQAYRLWGKITTQHKSILTHTDRRVRTTTTTHTRTLGWRKVRVVLPHVILQTLNPGYLSHPCCLPCLVWLVNFVFVFVFVAAVSEEVQQQAYLFGQLKKTEIFFIAHQLLS